MNNNRRNFLKKSLLGTLSLGIGSINDEAYSRILNQSDLSVTLGKGQSVMGLRCSALDTVRIAVIGLGRGGSAVSRLARIEGTQIVVIDDLVPERIANAQKTLIEAGRSEAIAYSQEDDWMKICERDDIDLIYNATPWDLHVPIAVYAMRHGKHVAIEVPAALTIVDCWKLVDTAEETQRHCMMLENCCYDFFELTTLNMERQGLFGEVFYGECAYIHDLRMQLDRSDSYHNTWRVKYYTKHTGNPYPTHGLGPIAQLLKINRGDRFDYLTSMSTDQRNLTLAAINKFGSDSIEAKAKYMLGDMNVSLIRTISGKTVMIQHDVTSPRPYDRIHKISGTKGYAVKYPEAKIALDPDAHEFLDADNFKSLSEKYAHPLSKYIGEKAKKIGGHGGMDYIMDWRLIYCLRHGLPLDQDVYDAATWSSIVELSEKSVLNRSQPIDVPDFTRGKWKSAQPWPIIDMENVFC
ncbi:MAG: Gfo/Idh/MocA family oxidoreductase [Massilibacteroides sp.]|nr:Gfo/Idh/MocA family oxidoreductase [Massilibacteroides sp.]MDD3061291.1 Gfo/Idh/MocA family oxidoreductase [Massilibacteroides sp.]MDD4114880.1 Gfo/Idh/MocA family oxidoreductase [Massilibacteroides sp.]MDD4659788.1 Gfo/Idh/MocA family oxidoreductase [Massilibacteroides sp.]